jgi:copper chaperone CopZ
MKHTQFKTTIKCGACVEKVRETLDTNVGADHWSVDLQSPDRILSTPDTVNIEKLIKDLDAVGYKATPIAS